MTEKLTKEEGLYVEKIVMSDPRIKKLVEGVSKGFYEKHDPWIKWDEEQGCLIHVCPKCGHKEKFRV